MLAVVALLGLAVWTLLPAHEPTYEGKSFSYWLRQSWEGADVDARAKAEMAVTKIGTNAIPTLLQMLRAKESPLKIKLLTWASQRHILRFRYIKGTINWRAAMVFRALGPQAASAVPELIKIYDQKISTDSEADTALALGFIGPDAKAAVPSLLRTAANTNSSNYGFAILALGGIHTDPDIVVPVLIRALRNPQPENRLEAARALGNFKGDAKPAVNSLVELINDPNVNAIPSGYRNAIDLRSEFEDALQQIDPETYAKVFTNEPAADGAK